jgi:hypothetical protein
VYTVCRGMTVCARCYIMFVYLNRSFLILFEHTNTDRAVTCALSRAKSEKKRGGGRVPRGTRVIYRSRGYAVIETYTSKTHSV